MQILITGGMGQVGTGVATSVRELAGMIISLFEKDLEVTYESVKKRDITDSYIDMLDMLRAKDVLGYKSEYSIEDGLQEVVK